METVGIIGSGTMGSGIAQVAATAGCTVMLFDSNPEALSKAKAGHQKILARLVEKGRLTADDQTAIQERLNYVSTLEALSGSDLVIEAIIEDLAIKRTVFGQLEKLVGPECILATNTSSLSVASIAASLEDPSRCIGLHFFNPAPLMRLVEVIPAVQTSNSTTERAVSAMTQWGKTVAVAKDTPGFIVNRVARPFYGEALRMYEEGLGTFAQIDTAMKQLGGFRMGPFELMDFIGNDVNYTVTETVFTAFYYDPRYKPSFTQKRMAEAGYLGRKSGRGYYDYSDGAEQEDGALDTAQQTALFERVLVMLINEAADALFLNIATAEGIDDAMTKGVNYPKGLLAWADEKGIDWCVKQMDALYDRYREDRYRCSPLLRSMAETNQNFF